ncbi:MAG: DMT family transporter [Phycisphaerales bacterium]|nr:DMT family transporter [Phycisphaerales bacterium]
MYKKQKLNSSKFLMGFIFAITACFFWSSHFFLGFFITYDKHFVYPHPPLGIAFYRWLITATITLPFCIRDIIIKRKTIFKKTHYFLCLGFTLYLANASNYFAYLHGTPTVITLLGSITTPLSVFILAFILNRHTQPIKINQLIGVVISIIAGVYLILHGSFYNLFNIHIDNGSQFALVQGIGLGLYTYLAKNRPADISLTSFICLVAMSAALLGFLVNLGVFFSTDSFYVPHKFDWFIVLFLGLFAGYFAYYFWNRAIIYLGTVGTGIFYCCVPLFAEIEIASFIPQRYIPPYVIHAGIFILLGLIIANLNIQIMKAKKKKKVYD